MPAVAGGSHCLPGGGIRGAATLAGELRSRILATGPITVADYMRRVLSSYYTRGPVFGPGGDFITAPDVSQLFGELLTVWFFHEWCKLGAPKPVQLVELGPGRGTLARDMVKVLQRLGLRGPHLSVHLVEVSRTLSRTQAEVLGAVPCTVLNGDSCLHYQSGHTPAGVPVLWYQQVHDVPHHFSLIVANEFFDALPIHKFQRTPAGWREVLVDLNPEDTANFRFIISREATPASRLLVKDDDPRDHLEVSPDSAAIAQHLATRLEEDGGISLVVDYGGGSRGGDTLRAFRQHHLHHPLEQPGTADITADVDFDYLRDAMGNRVVTWGPLGQGTFLRRMGIEPRLQVLLSRCAAPQRAALEAGFHTLVDPAPRGMGDRFQLLCMFPAVVAPLLLRLPVAAFSEGTLA